MSAGSATSNGKSGSIASSERGVTASDVNNYSVVVTGFGAATSSSALLSVINYQASQAPTISSQPQSRTNYAGTTATFSGNTHAVYYDLLIHTSPRESRAQIYGAVGGVILLLLWFYLSGLVIVIGAEMNAEIEHASPWAKAPGEKVRGEKKKIGAAAARAFRELGGVLRPAPQQTPPVTVHDAFWLPHGAPIVGNVAALVPHKGQRHLIDHSAS